MPDPSESVVEVPASGSGPNVRMLQITTLVNGVPTTVQMQVIQIADEYGNPIEEVARDQLMQELVDEMRAVRVGIQHLVSDGSAGIHEDLDLIEVSRAMRDDDDSSEE